MSAQNKTQNGTPKKDGLSRSAIVAAIVSGVLVLAFIVTLIAVVIVNANRSVSYLEDDLSKYVYVSEEDYKNFSVTIKPDEVTDASVERQIMSLLYKHRDEKSLYGTGYVRNIPITAGDVAYIYYRGYTVDENGKETDLERSCNFFDTDPHPLGIGSLQFIYGFEDALIGVVPKEYAQLEVITSGKIKPTDVIYLTYTVFLPNGETRMVNKERIDLSDPTLESERGEGFAKYFVGKTIGTALSSRDFKLENGTAVYSGMKVEAVTRCENEANVLTVDAHFPADYSEVSLRGLDVKFDVYIKGTNVHETPEYNDAFITEKLKISAEDLEGYEGTTLAEKHRAKIKADLIKVNEAITRTITEQAILNYLTSKVTVKKLPESEVRNVYDSYYNEIAYYYSLSSSSFSSIDQFARYYLDLSSSVNWKEHLRTRAEKTITTRLAFYYIIRQENIAPSEQEYEEIYNRIVEDDLALYISDMSYQDDIDKCETDEAKAAKREQIKAEMLKAYGDKYFKESVYNDHGLTVLINDYATIIEK